MKKTNNCKICGNLKDGKNQSYCKSCDNIRAKKYRKLNKDKISSSRKKFYLVNKDKVASRMKKYYLKNQDKVSSYHKKYYKRNKQIIIKKIIEYQKNRKYNYLISAREKARRKIDIPFDKLCEICNINKAVARHHPDYSYPLEVILICNNCHMKIHRKINPLIVQ